MPLAHQPAKKLRQAGVLAILKRGKRLSRPGFDVRFLPSSNADSLVAAQMAISVPKRLLKSAVARNRIKRLVRDELRRHRVSQAPFNILVTLNVKDDGKRADARRRMRGQLSALFDGVLNRANIQPKSPGAY